MHKRKTWVMILASVGVLVLAVALVLQYYDILPKRTYSSQHFGIDVVYSPQDYNHNGVDDYLEQSNAYYLVHGDTNFQWCTITSGTHISDQQVQLQYTKDDGTAWEVTMESRGDSYVFCSNIRR